jgi:hypothetical protein
MFTLAVDGVDLASEDVVESLVAGDLEVYPAVVAGKSILTYRVFAETSYDAVIDAVRHLLYLFPGIVVCRVEPDLVSISDIASRLGKPRESVRAWVIGSRGSGDFPIPLTVLGDNVRVWDWASVNSWLKGKNIDGYDDEHLLSREEIDELNVMLVRRFVGKSAKAFRNDLPISSSTTLTVRRTKVDTSVVAYSASTCSADAGA